VWVLTLTLLTCLSIDFSNPLLPGVVRFDDSESVYAVRAERARTDEHAVTRSVLPAPGPRSSALVVTPPRATLRAPERPRPVPAAVRPRALPSSSPTSAAVAGEDH
jgi:hypothetical protein